MRNEALSHGAIVSYIISPFQRKPNRSSIQPAVSGLA